MMRRLPLPPLLVAVAILAGCGADLQPADMTGSWGGPHLLLTLKSTGGTLEYDCASGTMAPDWTITPDGYFSATGTHSPGHGGPIGIGEDTIFRPAKYQGVVRGNDLQLTVVLTDSNQVLGTFDLIRGRSDPVFKCL